MIAALRALPYLASGAAVLAAWLIWQSSARKSEDIARLTRELATQAWVADQAALARDVADANARRLAARAAEYDALREALLKGHDDAPLPDWFRAYLDRLFAAGADGGEGARGAAPAP